MSRFLSVFKLAELASHQDPSLLSIVDSADVSLFFLSKLDESRRWICTFQVDKSRDFFVHNFLKEAALFIYTTTSRCRYRFAVFNKNINSALSIVSTVYLRVPAFLSNLILGQSYQQRNCPRRYHNQTKNKR